MIVYFRISPIFDFIIGLYKGINQEYILVL